MSRNEGKREEAVSQTLMLASLLLVLGFHVLLFFPLAIGSDSGWSIDLSCQHGGVGGNVSSYPPFFVGDRIILFAYVTYNQEPRQSVLVAFQVDNPQGSPLLVTTQQTNASGYASTNFTITENVYTIFPSNWNSTATTSPAQKTVSDSMPFRVLPRLAVGGTSLSIPPLAVQTCTRAVFVEILIAPVLIILAKFRVILTTDHHVRRARAIGFP